MAKHVVSMRIRHLPTWVYLSAGFLAPLPTLRILGINLTYFDLLILVIGILVLLYSVPKRVPGCIIGAGFFLILSLLTATFRAPDQMAAIEHILEWMFIFFAVIPIIYSAFRSERAFLFATVGLMLAMAVVAYYGIYEVFYLEKPRTGYRYRYGSIFGDPQVLGFQISVTIPFLLLLLRHREQAVRNRSLRLIFSAFVLSVTGVLVGLLPYSLSRTGVLATAISILTFVSLIGRNNKQLFVKVVIRASLAAVLLMGGFIIYLQRWAPGRVVARVEMSLSWDSPEVTDRTQVWKEVLTGIDPSYYLVGVGPDNSAYLSHFQEKPHNMVLLFLTEGGILAVVMLVTIFGSFFANTLSALKLKSAPFSREFLVATIASMSGYMVVAMLNTRAIQRFYWFVLVLGLSVASEIRYRSKARLRSTIGPKSFGGYDVDRVV